MLTDDEEESSKIMKGNLEDLQKELSSFGEIKEIGEGCIVLIFTVQSEEQLDKLKAGLETGELLKKLKNWLDKRMNGKDRETCYYEICMSHGDLDRAKQFFQAGR